MAGSILNQSFEGSHGVLRAAVYGDISIIVACVFGRGGTNNRGMGHKLLSNARKHFSTPDVRERQSVELSHEGARDAVNGVCTVIRPAW